MNLLEVITVITQSTTATNEAAIKKAKTKDLGQLKTK